MNDHFFNSSCWCLPGQTICVYSFVLDSTFECFPTLRLISGQIGPADCQLLAKLSSVTTSVTVSPSSQQTATPSIKASHLITGEFLHFSYHSFCSAATSSAALIYPRLWPATIATHGHVELQYFVNIAKFQGPWILTIKTLILLNLWHGLFITL